MKIQFVIINMASAINWLGMANIDRADICSSSLLSAAQKRLCSRAGVNPMALPTAARATIDTCIESMKNARWGCQMSRHNTQSREHAYINALSTAQLILSTEYTCKTGEQCRPAIGYARQMIGLEKAHSKLDQVIRQHNIVVGIEKLKQSTSQKCRCHGQSGACTQKTCWTESPRPDAIAHQLKAEYDQAVQVSNKNEADKVPLELALLTPFFADRLLFTRDSADFCSTTKGRTCQLDDITKESHCQNLCCRRGHLTKHYRVQKPGKCSFEWPDKINCESSTTHHKVKNICL